MTEMRDQCGLEPRATELHPALPTVISLQSLRERARPSKRSPRSAALGRTEKKAQVSVKNQVPTEARLGRFEEIANRQRLFDSGE